MYTPRHRRGPEPRGDRARDAAATEPVADFAGLLAVLECESPEELDLMLCTAFELDPCVIEVGPRHVVVAIRDRNDRVTFPCTVEDFWHSVCRLEWEAEQRLGDVPDDG
jgi:hypothetical protein